MTLLSRTGKTIHITALFLGGVVLALMINGLVLGSAWRVDFSKNRRQTLSETTLATLKKFGTREDAITIVYYFKPLANSDHTEEVKYFLGRYAEASPSIKVRNVDVDRFPGEARARGITRADTVLLEHKDKVMLAGSPQEALVTGAILRLWQDKHHKVYVTQGHGEPDILTGDSTDRTMHKVVEALTMAGYDVKGLVMPKAEGIPEDCTVLLLAGPRDIFRAEERANIAEFLRTKGAAMFLLDPQPGPSFGDVLSPFGIVVSNDLVVDMVQHSWNDPFTLAIAQYFIHPITASLGTLVLPAARSVGTAQVPPPRVSLTPLMASSDRSFSEMNPSVIEYNDGEDLPGPITVGVAATFHREGKRREGRLVVVGDGDFATDQYSGEFSNLSFVVNAVHWLAEGEDLLDIPARKPVQGISLPASVVYQMVWVCLFVIPGLPLLIGGGVWMWRRRLK